MDWLSFHDLSFVLQIGEFVDFLGVLVICVGLVFSTIVFLYHWVTDHALSKSYDLYRRNLGRVILLGLEFLVAGDIIRSVGGVPSFNSIIILGMIVVIRTFLSINFEMEMEGRWPWQKGKSNS